MSVAMRVNSSDLQHAASLGTIDTVFKNERNYDSEDEYSGRSKIKHNSSSELYARTSLYSREDIREQYCLTDRQFHTIERPRRDRFLGCLSRRTAPHSLLGGCVGHRIPSDEQLNTYTPFYKYPRYMNQLPINTPHSSRYVETSYLRRQPASILNTTKMVDAATDSTHNDNGSGLYSYCSNDNSNETTNYFNQQSRTGYITPAIINESTTIRPKHVSFARSNTLTSFDDMNVSLHTSNHIKSIRSQERLLGSKKPVDIMNDYCNTLLTCAPQISLMETAAGLRLVSQPTNIIAHDHADHSLGPHLGIIHQILPSYDYDKHIPNKPLTIRPTLLSDTTALQHLPNSLTACQVLPNRIPHSPEVIVVEKKFRNAMKTQATQTDIRKMEFEQNLALSPRTIHRVKVVSQGAQTNGIQNIKPLAKSLSQIPNDTNHLTVDTSVLNHEAIYRTNSEQRNHVVMDEHIFYYQPPTPPLSSNIERNQCYPLLKQSSITSKEESTLYESNSFPRRNYPNRLDVNFHSLPRPDAQNVQDVYKNITECNELMDELSSDIISDLLPPPQEYCREDEDSLVNTQTYPKVYKDTNRRKSTLVALKSSSDAPFRRDDMRRQSMPIYIKNEKSLNFTNGLNKTATFSQKSFRDDMTNEKEIIIDFKPYIDHKFQTEIMNRNKQINRNKPPLQRKYVEVEDSQYDSIESIPPVYENIPKYSIPISNVPEVEYSEPDEKEDNISVRSAPNSPLCEPPNITHVSSYLSSDSLANDYTKDHSDGHWNESEITVLTLEQRYETSLASNTHLTPATRRKNLLLQHQQRSSMDTDALDLEEQFADLNPSHSQSSLLYKEKSIQKLDIDKVTPILPRKLVSPVIEVTTDDQTSLPLSVTSAGENPPYSQLERKPFPEQSVIMSYESKRMGMTTNADVSECSTNTEEYATCTDTSKPIPSVRNHLTTITATSSSSSTHVAVSVQMDRTHGESSFESASSLHSSKGGEYLIDDLDQNDSYLFESKPTNELHVNFANLPYIVDASKQSPEHSVSTLSTDHYIAGDDKACKLSAAKEIPTSPLQTKETIRSKQISLSDDERSELRYSSSGYYESPQDEEYQRMKSRRHRNEEERKRRKAPLKIEFANETTANSNNSVVKEHLKGSPERQQTTNPLESLSPIKLKRFRPKIRRQIRRSMRDDSTISLKQRKSSKNLSPVSTIPSKQTVDLNLRATPTEEMQKLSVSSNIESASKMNVSLSPASSEIHHSKDKSIESLNRSVSPGSDSVFYSEADGSNTVNDLKNESCLPYNKDFIESSGILAGESIESLPYIDNEPDIVNPPSDFADSPIISKTHPSRLYRKIDKRFRSEERYQIDRGRYFKIPKETIRAKSEERNQEGNKQSTYNLRTSGSSPCILPATNLDNRSQTIYVGHYDCGRYARLTDSDVWAQLNHQSLERQKDRRPSTDSENSFCTKYQVILHRLVQRRCTLEMYHRQKNDIFRVDKTVVVKSETGEFGFRIHGSKPVVVAAIEPDTPAESSGLEVGDILISVNGVQVLDKHHTEVVKIAHDGCEKLELEVARTLVVLMNEQQEPPVKIIHSGYLWRQSGQAKGIANSKKWVQRWFTLRSDNCLYYYKTEEDSQPVGAVIMAKHAVEACPTKIGRPFGFKVDVGEGIPLYLAADSEELANIWMQVLRKAANQDNKWLDKSARNLYKTPNSILRPDCYGYLMKLGSKWCGWSQCYCVLKDACLYFYPDANSKSALGMACLHGYKVTSMATSNSTKKNAFEVIPPDSKLRHYYFYTESEMEKKRWISALEYSIDRWIKSG